MPDGTEFGETFQDAQEDLERREKNAKKTTDDDDVEERARWTMENAAY